MILFLYLLIQYHSQYSDLNKKFLHIFIQFQPSEFVQQSMAAGFPVNSV